MTYTHISHAGACSGGRQRATKNRGVWLSGGRSGVRSGRRLCGFTMNVGPRDPTPKYQCKHHWTVFCFDFSGTKAFDKNTGFRTQSVLNVPLKNHEDDIIGVVQLINARDITTCN